MKTTAKKLIFNASKELDNIKRGAVLLALKLMPNHKHSEHRQYRKLVFAFTQDEEVTNWREIKRQK